MTQMRKIVLSSSRDIPFNKLVLSQANVRRIKAGVSVEELAEDIARRTLLQSLTVRAVRDADGADTGMFEVPAGGRRYRALERLVKQKRLAKTAPIPCVVREDGLAEEDSLAENVQRAPLHPLDQFRAFQALREKGQSEEEIAAAFFVSAAVVRQRLRLASVSPRLLDVYADDGLTLDQLMAFTVNPDHERQEQVFEALTRAHSREPYQIRRLLTEGAVRACDRRAQFVGPAYEDAGGLVMRDLFQGDDGGWLQDPVLLDRLVAERLEREVVAIQAEGWKWVEAAVSLPYGHTYGLRRLTGEAAQLSEEEVAARDALKAEHEGLEETWAQVEDLPEAVDARLGEIEAALEALQDRPVAYAPEDVARAGAFITIDGSGELRVERGFVRPEDEAPLPATPESDADAPSAGDARAADASASDAPVAEASDADEGLRPIPDRLVAELTAHRTLALRDALGADPHVAFTSALHALALKLFYRFCGDTCLELDVKSAAFNAQAPGLADTASAKSVDARHQAWAAHLPKEPGELWDALRAWDEDSRQALFAHCVALSVNATIEPYNRRPRAIAQADQLAQAVRLDMVAAGWAPTAENYLARVTKARILLAVREAKDAAAASRLEPLKKDDMAAQAEQVLAGSGWLPEPLRTPGVWTSEETAAVADEPAIDPDGAEVDADDHSAAPHAHAAE
ncbi:ParB/Srx family N-terminal domain-containing protein [Phenylobacterium sp.]|uniref:ParB/RepB/Spo0J family partition protein n=1 Tax=Phenylobacterium sp. TaxID=1871053 RepID=UPI0028A1A10E|nr:ParB/Srx family N-terminal domain-containing protein [Phenylobacterium sp.]